MTAPYAAAAEALIRSAHEQRVSLTLTDGVTEWTTTLLTGDLTCSEDWSPRFQLSAVVPNIFSLADLAAIDPREHAVRATVTAGYVYPDGTTDLHTIFTGHLRERRVKRPQNIVQLEAWSDEGLAQDACWLDTAQFKTFTGITEALEWFASYATGASVTISSSVGLLYRSDLTGSIPVTPGQNIWEIMRDLALAANVQLYCDPEGTWTVAAKVTEAGPDPRVLDRSSDSDDVLARNGYYSAAVLTYQWQDAMGVDHTIYGKYGTLPGRVFTAEYDYAITQAAADAAAQATVRNLSTRGDGYTTTDVSAYWSRPGDTVRVTLAAGVDANHIARQIVFHLVNGTMTTTTRQPSNLGD